ncbi:MAG: Lrp/AsnC family transcriptional regulator [Candidatus Hydrothermarchaeota archaeon]|nr:MAG: Lrp/AsnC family transcriptional regulator [Candidatus Hydrothermarchaeota archaeon]RLG58938.1 MAG: Lrp/AsnC family transcriptional regulator [Candidatus Hydrothermarchaeota archaeon]
MVVGVCMINVELGREKEIKNKLAKIDEIKELVHVFGEYDFIAIIETEGLKSLNEVVDNIRTIDGVTATRTIIGAEF